MTAAAVIAGFVGVASVRPADRSAVPEKVLNFRLTDTTRLAHEALLLQYAAIVLMSQANGSKLSRDAAGEPGSRPPTRTGACSST